MRYPFSDIESTWQRYWEEHGTFVVTEDPARPKYYVLDMFPYPSGAGLHVGHPEGYTATDILSRYRRAFGLHVLHPMGWDAFGLPAEQYAIQTGQHPRVTTEKNIATFKRQIKALGFCYDWSREVNTTDPATRFSAGAVGNSSFVGVRSAIVMYPVAATNFSNCSLVTAVASIQKPPTRTRCTGSASFDAIGISQLP